MKKQTKQCMANREYYDFNGVWMKMPLMYFVEKAWQIERMCEITVLSIFKTEWNFYVGKCDGRLEMGWNTMEE